MARIRKSGGYRQLASFQTATLIYDATVWFCEKFIDRFSRTSDQMVQAARSGRQNIAEGSRAGATSSQTELRLVNVARSSLEELLLDFEDYLRHRRLTRWDSNGPDAKAVRQVAWGQKDDRSDQAERTQRTDLTQLTDDQRWGMYSQWLDHSDSAVRANAMICLIHQANYLLDQQLDALESQFINEGGYSEQLATARLTKRAEDRRRTHDTGPQSNPATKPMASARKVHLNGPSLEPQIGNSRSDVSVAARSGESDVGWSVESSGVRWGTNTEDPPACPRCGGLMTLRTAKTGRHAGSQFWGCASYPQCQGTAEV
jgi:four helix bundle suffix protein